MTKHDPKNITNLALQVNLAQRKYAGARQFQVVYKRLGVKYAGVFDAPLSIPILLRRNITGGNILTLLPLPLPLPEKKFGQYPWLVRRQYQTD